MGDGRRNFCGSLYFRRYRLIIKRNIKIIVITIIFYVLNQNIKNLIPNNMLRWFMTCYFNDTIGGMTFVAYCSIITCFRDRRLRKLHHIEILMFFCGIFWEYVTPLFRENTVSDPYDILAYMLGGFLYWLIMLKGKQKNKYINKIEKIIT